MKLTQFKWKIHLLIGLTVAWMCPDLWSDKDFYTAIPKSFIYMLKHWHTICMHVLTSHTKPETPQAWFEGKRKCLWGTRSVIRKESFRGQGEDGERNRVILRWKKKVQTLERHSTQLRPASKKAATLSDIKRVLNPSGFILDSNNCPGKDKGYLSTNRKACWDET